MAKIINTVWNERKDWLVAGLIATLVLTIFMEGVARVVLGGPMKPAMMICAILGLDLSFLWLGEIVHYAVGLIAFPIGFVVYCLVLKQQPGLWNGAIWGVILWIAAGALMAPLSGGALFFGWGMITIASLVAHLAYGITLGAVYKYRR